MTDTVKASNITDHPFMPRHGSPWVCGYIYNGDQEPKMCRMAEAAHRETTVKRAERISRDDLGHAWDG